MVTHMGALILMVLGLLPEKPVHGVRMLAYESYLLCRELGWPECCPFLDQWAVWELANGLELLGFIRIAGRKVPEHAKFTLLDRGSADYLLEKFGVVGEKRERLRKIRKGWDQLGVEGMRNYLRSRWLQPYKQLLEDLKGFDSRG